MKVYYFLKKISKVLTKQEEPNVCWDDDKMIVVFFKIYTLYALVEEFSGLIRHLANSVNLFFFVRIPTTVHPFLFCQGIKIH